MKGATVNEVCSPSLSPHKRRGRFEVDRAITAEINPQHKGRFKCRLAAAQAHARPRSAPRPCHSDEATEPGGRPRAPLRRRRGPRSPGPGPHGAASHRGKVRLRFPQVADRHGRYLLRFIGLASLWKVFLHGESGAVKDVRLASEPRGVCPGVGRRVARRLGPGSVCPSRTAAPLGEQGTRLPFPQRGRRRLGFVPTPRTRARRGDPLRAGGPAVPPLPPAPRGHARACAVFWALFLGQTYGLQIFSPTP